MYIKKLDKIVDRYNKIYQRAIKMKPAILVIMKWQGYDNSFNRWIEEIVQG